MKLPELKTEIQKYQYMEDTSIIDVSIASIIANRLKFGDPIWLMIVGASSGGKSQILRPLSMTEPLYIHRVDDLTENTLLSGAKSNSGDTSMLHRIGNEGIIVISDFTVIMSKSDETRNAIMSQFRMLYDGEMIKNSGSSVKPIRWPEKEGSKGYMGILAGCTPSIYDKFDEVADMGQRFIYYRMREFDDNKATRLALKRKTFGRDLDQKLSDVYKEYIDDVGKSTNGIEIEIPDEVDERIIEVASFAERVRTTAKMDYRQEVITRIPSKALPIRIALQLSAIVKGLGAIQYHETGEIKFTEETMSIIDWLGYSLANEEKRACLKILASVPFGTALKTSIIADQIGLNTHTVGTFLQNLSAVGVLERSGMSDSLVWTFKDEKDYSIVRRIEHITKDIEYVDRDQSSEEKQDKEALDLEFKNF